MGNLSRAESTLRELSNLRDDDATSPAWQAALEHYRQTAIDYALTDLESQLGSYLDELDVKSGDLRMWLVVMWREIGKIRNP